ncbi:MAG TPA: TIGR03619 family F420-dependent LLM class oxidoreductase [Streptosporangiaceae bacterium]|nr:TIGR03619 family F420-dependent LLM class oxidoreductase [Streptosporangiaceae bacterium]
MTDGLKFGLYGLQRGAGADPATLARWAQRAEHAGFESLWMGDHIALPADQGGRQPRLEVVVAISYLAAVTTRIRLAFGVLVLPQRQPVLLAKQVSSIDLLSRGRLTVGIGVGYVEPELQALGASLADRGARTDEYLAAMQALWAEPEPSFAGRFVTFAGVTQQPPPVQRPHPPIVVGGHSEAACRRAATTASGWYGVYLDVEEAGTVLDRLRRVAARCERPAGLGELEITVEPPGRIGLDTARRYADLGVHRLVLQPVTEDGSDMDELIDTTAATLIGRA